jgi:hypothetical protein
MIDPGVSLVSRAKDIATNRELHAPQCVPWLDYVGSKLI